MLLFSAFIIDSYNWEIPLFYKFEGETEETREWMYKNDTECKYVCTFVQVHCWKTCSV